MSSILPYIELAAGLMLLILAGDALVRGAVGLADRLRIPAIIIGLTVVAFGTSAPELMVSLTATLGGVPAIALGNVVGSNIANVLLVLGLPALIAATQTDQPFAKRNTVFMILTSAVFVGLCFTNVLTFWHGLLLVTLLTAFLLESARCALKGRGSALEEVDEPGVNSIWLAIVLVVAGMVGLPIGADFTVDGAADIARAWGVSDAAIGLTVVAIGTSLPELTATMLAAVRREAGLAVGNVIGSNMFNLLAIMGITALVAPVPVDPKFLSIDLWVMMATALLILPFVWWSWPITRVVGAGFVAAYVAYAWFALSPGPIEARAPAAPSVDLAGAR